MFVFSVRCNIHISVSCQCPSVWPSVCHRSALEHYSEFRFQIPISLYRELRLPFCLRADHLVPCQPVLDSLVVIRFNALQSPMKQRREKLEDSLRWHQLNFDADSELQWIKDHRPAATSTDYGKNLNDAQNLHAKQKVGRHSALSFSQVVTCRSAFLAFCRTSF